MEEFCWSSEGNGEDNEIKKREREGKKWYRRNPFRIYRINAHKHINTHTPTHIQEGKTEFKAYKSSTAIFKLTDPNIVISLQSSNNPQKKAADCNKKEKNQWIIWQMEPSISIIRNCNILIKKTRIQFQNWPNDPGNRCYFHSTVLCMYVLFFMCVLHDFIHFDA